MNENKILNFKTILNSFITVWRITSLYEELQVIEQTFVIRHTLGFMG